MRTIAVLNQKGGVGKTTTTVNLAAALAAMGQRVIVIDMDPQAHLTIHLGIEPETLTGSSYEVLTQSAGFEASLMMIRPNLWLLAADINLVGAETELVTVVGREIILREAMAESIDKFDYCLIDCAPSLGLLSLNALAAAQEVLIPLQPHFLALQGFGKLLQTVDLVNKRINPALKVTGVLLCMFDTRASLPNEVRADIERFLEAARGSGNAWSDAQVLPTFIRRNIKLAEAPSYGQTIFEYDPTCNGAEDYKGVAQFFLGVETSPEPELQVEESEVQIDESELPTENQEEPQSGYGIEVISETEINPAVVAESAPENIVESAPESIIDRDIQIESLSHVHPEDPGQPGPPHLADPEPQNVIESEPMSGSEVKSDPEPRPEQPWQTESAYKVDSEHQEIPEPYHNQEARHDHVAPESETISESKHTCRPETEAGHESIPTASATNAWSETDRQPESELESKTESELESGQTSEDQSQDTERPEAPIEIREVPQPQIRRYTPPPLQKFPIPPSRRQDH